MIILVVILAVIFLVVWLPLRYGIDGTKNPPPMPPAEEVFYVVPKDWSNTPRM